MIEEMPVASFSTLAVLTAATGKPFTRNDVLVREVLGFVLSDVVLPAQQVAAIEVAGPLILAQHPRLARFHLPRNPINGELDDRRRAIVKKLGATIEVSKPEAPEWLPFRGLDRFLSAVLMGTRRPHWA